MIERSRLTPEQDQAYRLALGAALEIGAAVLRRGGTALDAVEAAGRALEDNPLFNAGRGAAIDASGRVTLDAAIMDGNGQTAGAVAGVATTRNPISLARAVMERTPHVFLIGEGADLFAREQGLEQVPNTWFMTARRWSILEEVLREQNLPLPPRPEGLHDGVVASGPNAARTPEARFSTIGVVARDMTGGLAAGTSTGGLTGKRWGRVGDVPVIGAGTWASRTCAVSGTGTGEYFIRIGVARGICERLARNPFELQAAADNVVKGELAAMGGDGGVIVMDASGEAVFSMNTEGMYRARLRSGGAPEIAIYADE